jgi:hypothetical protein
MKLKSSGFESRRRALHLKHALQFCRDGPVETTCPACCTSCASNTPHECISHQKTPTSSAGEAGRFRFRLFCGRGAWLAPAGRALSSAPLPLGACSSSAACMLTVGIAHSHQTCGDKKLRDCIRLEAVPLIRLPSCEHG